MTYSSVSLVDVVHLVGVVVWCRTRGCGQDASSGFPVELATCGMATWIMGTADDGVPADPVCPMVKNWGVPWFSPRTWVVKMGMRDAVAVESICGVRIVAAPPDREAGM